MKKEEKGMRIGVIVQARMGSTRLPGKILMKLDDNDTVLDVLIKRLKKSTLIDEIIIATTPDKSNSVIIDKAKSHKVSFFIGSEENVLERYYKAAKEFNLDIVIRACSDNPFIDPKILDDLIVFYKNNNYDYVKINHETSNFPLGTLNEIFPFKILKKIYKLSTSKAEKEHVTYYIYSHPKMFSLCDYNKENLKNIKHLRITIDEEKDLIMCRALYKKLKEKRKSIDFSLYDIIEIVEEYPELMNINKTVSQKKV